MFHVNPAEVYEKVFIYVIFLDLVFEVFSNINGEVSNERGSFKTKRINRCGN